MLWILEMDELWGLFERSLEFVKIFDSHRYTNTKSYGNYVFLVLSMGIVFCLSNIDHSFITEKTVIAT